MFLPIIMVIINALAVMTINTTYSAKVAAYVNEVEAPIKKNEMVADEVIFSAVNQICIPTNGAEGNECYTALKESETRDYTLMQLKDYIPSETIMAAGKMTNAFKKITIDLKNGEIRIMHNISNKKEREDYIDYYLNAKYSFKCATDGKVLKEADKFPIKDKNGSFVACSNGDILKIDKMNKVIHTKILDKQIAEAQEESKKQGVWNPFWFLKLLADLIFKRDQIK